MKLTRYFERLNPKRDLQAKILLILVAVIVPTFLIVTFAENKLTQPLLEDEIKKVGVTAARNLAREIVSSHWLQLADPVPAIEGAIQEIIYSQPNIIRIDVFARDPISGAVRPVGSNVEQEEDETPFIPEKLADRIAIERRAVEDDVDQFEIQVPIEQRARDPHSRKVLGAVHLVVSLKLVDRLVSTLWRTTFGAALFSVVTLILVLSYLLRKAINNERRLRQAENKNLQLATQLHDAHRQLMNTEKLAVMGQLTASFAHEIGTPLNAIGGHLQLLGEEMADSGRLKIIVGQVGKIEEIVKGFLQSTAKPASQRQLVDLNALIERTLGIVSPRVEAMEIEIRRRFDRNMGPVRVVPLDLEQVLLNLLNNSIDSMKAKAASSGGKLRIDITTSQIQKQGGEWAEISVYDTGEGISRADLENVTKPFFTTKRPGEGTGLGLTICHQLVQKYGGTLKIDSKARTKAKIKEESWTEVTIRLPYGRET